MEQKGEYAISASREKVWEALNDPEVLGRCIPGCLSIDKTSDTQFRAKVKAKIGPVSATFDADLNLKNLNPPAGYTIEGGVKGGAAGFGKGEADVELVEQGPATLLRYAVNASVGGKLAQIGSRLVDGAARKMADEFFAAFSALVSEGDTDASTTSASSEDSASGDGVAETSAGDAAQAEQNTAAAETIEPSASQEAPSTAEQTSPQYEKSGTGFVWIVAFVVLAAAIILAI